jgi:GTP cyclohydrolase II
MTDFLRHLGSRCSIPTDEWGELTFESISVSGAIDGDLLVTFPEFSPSDEVMVRVHSECVFAERFSSVICDCDTQFDLAMRQLSLFRNSALFFLRIDGRGAGLSAKVAATHLEMEGLNTYDSRRRIGVSPDSRDFSGVGRILAGLGVKRVQLLTNNPEKTRGLESLGITVRTEPLIDMEPNAFVRDLYATKRDRFGHDL